MFLNYPKRKLSTRVLNFLNVFLYVKETPTNLSKERFEKATVMPVYKEAV